MIKLLELMNLQPERRNSSLNYKKNDAIMFITNVSRQRKACESELMKINLPVRGRGNIRYLAS